MIDCIRARKRSVRKRVTSSSRDGVDGDGDNSNAKDKVDGDDDDDLEPSVEDLEKEERIEDACNHVNQARGQRELCKEIMCLAEQDALSLLPHSETSRCIVMDYSQNAGLPQFADT